MSFQQSARSGRTRFRSSRATTDQYLAVFAFDLSANGVKLDHPLDGPTAQQIVLHP